MACAFSNLEQSGAMPSTHVCLKIHFVPPSDAITNTYIYIYIYMYLLHGLLSDSVCNF